MTQSESLWRFLRGDMLPHEFETWACSDPGLEADLGEELYLELISADYSSCEIVSKLKKRLQEHLVQAGHLRCYCMTLPNLADVGMGSALQEHVFASLETIKNSPKPIHSVSLYRCRECQQHWLIGEDQIQNDVYFLERLGPESAEQIDREDRWPATFEKYETLLRLGKERGHSVSYLDFKDSPLSFLIESLARERPGIRVFELALLLNIEIDVAEQMAKNVGRATGVSIDFEKR